MNDGSGESIAFPDWFCNSSGVFQFRDYRFEDCVEYFDVIIGNPPYQMKDGGGEGSSAVSLYNKFVNQAKVLKPRHIAMIIPARWYTGGRGLNDFRLDMLTDGKLAELHDFAETDLVFPGINIRGGVCYFHWYWMHSGPVRVTNYSKSR